MKTNTPNKGIYNALVDQPDKLASTPSGQLPNKRAVL